MRMLRDNLILFAGLCSDEIFAGRPANYKIVQMAVEHMLGKTDAKKFANMLIERVCFQSKDMTREKIRRVV